MKILVQQRRAGDDSTGQESLIPARIGIPGVASERPTSAASHVGNVIDKISTYSDKRARRKRGSEVAFLLARPDIIREIAK